MAVPGGDDARGLRGMKAFGVVLGSGVLAAFLVFALISGLLNLVFGKEGVGKGESNGSPGAVAGTGKPHKNLPPDKLNLCSTTIDSLGSVTLNRVDNGDNYLDSANSPKKDGRKFRTVVDDCRWTLSPEYSVIKPWNFSFSYIAFIPSSASDRTVNEAKREFSEKSGKIETGFSDVALSSTGEFGDQSKTVVGEGSEPDNLMKYSVVGRTKSAVYEIEFLDENKEEIPKSAFDNEVNKILEGVELDINQWIPDGS